MVGMNITTTIPEDDRESVLSSFTSLTKESPVRTYVNRNIRHDGAIRWVRWTDRALFNDEGRLESIQSFGMDITDVQKAQKAIQTERDKAQKYLDVAEVIMLALNEKGEITLINNKGCQILGYQEDELIGRDWFNTCLPERNREEVQGVFKKILTGEEGLSNYYENQVLTKSGEERIIAWHNTLLWEWEDRKKYITGILSSGEDITGRVRAEQLLNALNRAAVAMGAAQTHQEIFNAISGELKQLDIDCMLFPLDESGSKVFTKYMSYESAELKTAEKLTGITHADFSILIDSNDPYRRVFSGKKAVFIEDSENSIQQVLPEFAKKFASQIKKILGVPKSIVTPLIVEDKVIAVFSIQSDSLIQEDIPIVTAFADQLSFAWEKINLLQDLLKTVKGTIYTIASVVEKRDPYTAGHQARVADLAAKIAREMKLTDERVEGIKMAGLIHDMGKIQVPAEILSKPGKISELEYEIIKTHPRVGYDLLKNIKFPWPIAQMVLQHHERMDGSGYPQGLKGDAIMLEARILAVADIVEAMSSHRPYRPALGVDKALKQIKKDRGTRLDPDAVDACLKIFKGGYALPEG